MISEIPKAKLSPRNVNGVLKFYEGDTFTCYLTLELTDQSGAPVILDGSESEVKFCFYDSKNRLVKEFVFGGEAGGEINENKMNLDFDCETTALFHRGKYTYDCALECGGKRITLVSGALLAVD